MQFMMKTMLASALVYLAIGAAVSRAGDCICDITCPECQHVCKFSWEKEKEEKSCWKIKIEPVCIPRITFPWQSCCDPKCAKMKYVRKLEKHEYECEVCKCKWTPVCAGCQGGVAGRCGAGADCATVPAQILDATDLPAADAAPAVEPAPEPPMPPALDARRNPGASYVAPASLQRSTGGRLRLPPVSVERSR